ncbi:NBR1-Ig-like domain-containing protein [Pseudoduganella violacea]|uniref:RHS repeat-associated protein n=1 Tax=Pseudoduganella violacea TaxID=1715466 RepID=A0A7W5BE54_9BURK|nr:NBR1-Ig-like domain-containing protein [Pseudoduganella violacea]MBB3121514.1 RHS repeat-associated protein [Pseudoduganella violacea]
MMIARTFQVLFALLIFIFAGPVQAVSQTCLSQTPASGTYTATRSGGSLWGTQQFGYTTDSNVGMALLHAGLVAEGASANVTITPLDTKSNFPGSTANGVTSASYAPSWCAMKLAVSSSNATPPVRTGTNGAEFVSQSVPSTMVAGQRYSITVAMRNSGTSTWTAERKHLLGSQNPQDNKNWGNGRVDLPGAVAPGQTASFTFDVTAPTTPGSYNMQWRMLEEYWEWFGASTPNVAVTVTPRSDECTAKLPANGTYTGSRSGGTVWGTKEFGYTTDSNIPALLVHSGLLADGESGVVTFSSQGTKSNFPGTTANGVTSSSYASSWCAMGVSVAPVPRGVNQAEFVSQSVPASMLIGQTYTVSVTMKNTGTSTWTAARKHLLGSQNPQDNQTWRSPDRVALPSSVAPGQTATFSFEVKAPKTPGAYNFQWRMLEEFVEWFGAVTPNVSVNVAASSTGNGATFVSQSVPLAMRAGQPYNVTVTMLNTGTSTWSEGQAYRLGGQNPQDARTWQVVSRAYLSGSVAPGERGTFTIPITAPQKPGTYNFQWRMLRESYEWFGDTTPNLSIAVANGAGPTATLKATPTNVRVSGAASATITVEGNGSGSSVTLLELFVDSGKGYGAAVRSAAGSSSSLNLNATVSLPAGVHHLKLRSTDSSGVQTDSLPVTVNVTNSALLGAISGIRINAANRPELFGWTCQAGVAAGLNYQVLLDDPTPQAGGQLLTSGVANVSSEADNAAVQAQCGTPGAAHHFVVDLSSYVSQYAGRPLYVYALNAGGDVSASLPCPDNSCTMPGSMRIGISTPNEGDRYPAPATVFMRAVISAGDGSYDEVAFNFNGEWIAAAPDSAAGAYYVNKTNVPAGTYTIYAKVRDGNTTLYTAKRQIAVGSSGVALALNSPSNGGSGSTNSAVSLRATASGATASVKSVKFYANGAQVATGTASGDIWSASWTPLQANSYQVVAQAFDGSGIKLAESAAATVTISSGGSSSSQPLPVSVDVPHLGNPDAGSLPGSLHVGNDGSAQYTMALPVPPGTAGMAPALSLTYSSTAGNGLVGLGWSLQGLSQIHRCAKFIARDGVAGRVNFSLSDRLCLDGQRLLRADGGNPGGGLDAQDGAYWAAGAVYRTEQESFVRVTRLGNGGFKAEHKDGRISYYGIDAGSAIAAQGRSDGQPLLWALARTEDRLGNYISMDYNQDAGSGEFTPRQIRYGGNSAAGLAPDLAVRFSYEGRGDVQLLYTGGSRADLRSRLSHVQTYIGTAADGSGGTLVRDHQIHYVESSGSGRSLVDWMQASATNPVTGVLEYLPKTVFESGAAAVPAFAPVPGIAPFALPAIGRVDADQLQGDFDGSGRTSFIAVKGQGCGQPGEPNCVAFPNQVDGRLTGELRIRQSDGRIYDRKLNIAAMNITTNLVNGISGMMVADLNGDGREDLVVQNAARSQWGVCLSQPMGDGSIDFNCMPGGSDVPSLVDLRNDRRTHLITKFDASGRANDCFHEGSGIRCQPLVLKELPPLPDGNGRLLTLDFFKPKGINLSREGVSDLYSTWETMVPAANPSNPYTQQCDGGRCWPVDQITGATVCFNGQSEFACQSLFQSRSVGHDNSWIDSGIGIGDVNGDGLTDFIYGRGGAASGTYLCLSKETGADCRLDGSLNAYLDPAWPDVTNLVHAKIGDFLGDGTSRLLVSLYPSYRWPNDPAVKDPKAMLCRYTGSGFTCQRFAYSEAADRKSQAVFLNNSGVPMFLVKTGTKVDGKDVLSAVTLAVAPSQDRLVRVTNGLGQVEEVDYARGDDAAVYARTAQVDGRAIVPVYPQVGAVTGAMVKQLRSANGQGGWLRNNYRYEGGMADAWGRGALGFTKVQDIDGQSQMSTTSVMLQTFPFIGRVDRTQVVSSAGVMVSDIRNSYAQTPMSFTSGSNGVFVYPDASTVIRKDLDGSEISTVGTNSYYTDGWGNLTRQTVLSSAGGRSYGTTTVNTYKNDSNAWLLGLLETSNVTKSNPAGANVTHALLLEYDGNGLLKKETIEPNTPLQVVITLDRSGNAFGLVNKRLQSWQDPQAGAATRTLLNVGYDPRGRFALSTSNALGHSETRSFFPGTGVQSSLKDANQLQTRWTADGFGRVTSEVRPDGNESRYYYKACQGGCPRGAATASIVESYHGADRISTPVVSYADSAGREVRKLNWGFDGRQIILERRFDERGRLYESDQPRYGNDPAYLDSRWLYDDLDRTKEQTTLDESGRELKSSAQYQGRVRTFVNAKNQRRVETRDALGLLEKVEDAGRGVTSYTYDGFGNLLTTTDPNQNVITVEYDRLGRKTDLRDPDLGWIHYDVDPVGRVWKQTSPVQRAKGQTTRFEFDAIDRTTGRYEPDLESHWTYDSGNKAIGRLSEAYTLRAGNKDYRRLHSYDSLGRSAGVTTVLGDANYVANVEYDAWSRAIRHSYQRGSGPLKSYDLRYNNKDYLARVERSGLVLWQVEEQDAAQRLLSERLGNGLVQSHGYDPRTARLRDGVLKTAAQQVRVQDSYQYDALGNVKQRTQYWDTDGFIEDFDYDDLNRLKSSQVAGRAQQVFGYDNAGGNLSSKTGLGNYQYPPQGSGSTRPHAVQSISGVPGTFSYDINGNLLSGAGKQYTWSSFDKPNTISKGGITSTFAYGAEQQRTRQDRSDGLVITYGGAQESENRNGSVTVKTYWPHGLGLELDRPDGSTELLWTHEDRLGSIVALSNVDGVLKEKLAYDAWGKRRQLDGSATPDNLDGQLDERGFTGHEMLDQQDLVHMNGRVYDPFTARFASADPHLQDPQDGQNYNRYSYVLNNPTNLVDPSGYDAIVFVYGMRMPSNLSVIGAMQQGMQQSIGMMMDTVRMAPQTMQTVYVTTKRVVKTYGPVVARHVGKHALRGAAASWVPVVGEVVVIGLGVYGVYDAYGEIRAIHAANKKNPLASDGSTTDQATADAPKPGSKESDKGCIYCVPGDKTSSGDDYIGTTDNMDQRKRDKSDGRDREGAQIIGEYNKGNREERRNKEQQAINDHGGVGNLDNRRNEVRETKWPANGIQPPPKP